MPSAHNPAAHTAVMITIRSDRDVRFNMAIVGSDLKTTIGLLRRFAETRPLHYPVILCLVTGPKLPEHCAEMLRSPNPPTGAPFNGDFGRFVAAEIAMTPALHDGAIILSRFTAEAAYCIS